MSLSSHHLDRPEHRLKQNLLLPPQLPLLRHRLHLHPMPATAQLLLVLKTTTKMKNTMTTTNSHLLQQPLYLLHRLRLPSNINHRLGLRQRTQAIMTTNTMRMMTTNMIVAARSL